MHNGMGRCSEWPATTCQACINCRLEFILQKKFDLSEVIYEKMITMASRHVSTTPASEASHPFLSSVFKLLLSMQCGVRNLAFSESYHR
jgi:hypothetical protein